MGITTVSTPSELLRNRIHHTLCLNHQLLSHTLFIATSHSPLHQSTNRIAAVPAARRAILRNSTATSLLRRAATTASHANYRVVRNPTD